MEMQQAIGSDSNVWDIEEEWKILISEVCINIKLPNICVKYITDKALYTSSIVSAAYNHVFVMYCNILVFIICFLFKLIFVHN